MPNAEGGRGQRPPFRPDFTAPPGRCNGSASSSTKSLTRRGLRPAGAFGPAAGRSASRSALWAEHRRLVGKGRTGQACPNGQSGKLHWRCLGFNATARPIEVGWAVAPAPPELEPGPSPTLPIQRGPVRTSNSGTLPRYMSGSRYQMPARGAASLSLNDGA